MQINISDTKQVSMCSRCGMVLARRAERAPDDAASPAGDSGRAPRDSRPRTQPARWALISNHGAALAYVARHPDATLRQVAGAVGVTERSATAMLRDLREAGYVDARRVGRRNRYTVDLNRPLRRAAYQESTVGELLGALHALAPDTQEPARAI